ncbi:PREDICTED: melanocortin-2 receptor accessory protein isoform X2 [Poecilia mexicana]|uniref:melanocortin-2 receptor accessory protein isoform X2 n=1 Tax=Poecilia mexicana TaxID=48701 RepID=UPI00072E598B|nr:PREDICTED: melanocortin-2 receptor accessory protein isoform X2 [Poecilia mexicana]
MSKFRLRNRTASYFSKNDTVAVPGNSTSAPLYEWEYYLDYLDPVFVDESQLKYHKYSIVIILWVSLAAFVGFLFLILNLMSLSVELPKINKSKIKRHHKTPAASPLADTGDGSDGCLDPC